MYIGSDFDFVLNQGQDALHRDAQLVSIQLWEEIERRIKKWRGKVRTVILIIFAIEEES